MKEKDRHKLAQILNVDEQELSDIDIRLPIKTIPKVGYVQAGKFNEACQLPENEWETIPYPINDNYKKANIFALGVRGDSMNLVFPPDKTTLICCPLADWLEVNNSTDIEGKYIIAYRRTPDGLCEATVKNTPKLTIRPSSWLPNLQIRKSSRLSCIPIPTNMKSPLLSSEI